MASFTSIKHHPNCTIPFKKNSSTVFLRSFTIHFHPKIDRNMNFQNLMKWPIVLFHILGYYSCSSQPHSQNRTPLLPFFKFFPTIMLMVIALSVCILGIILEKFYAIYYNQTDSIVSLILIIVELISSLTVIQQSLVRSDNLNKTIELLQSIELYLRREFQFKLDFRVFSKRYLTKVLAVLSAFLLMLGIRMFVRSDENILLLEFGYCTMRFLSILAKLHALLYVNLLKSFIKFTTDFSFVQKDKVIRLSANREVNIIETMKHYKFIHFKLYVACLAINNFFGWSLVMQCVQSFLDGVYALYWIFCYMQSDTHYKFVIRKHVFIRI